MKDYIKVLVEGKDLSYEEAKAAMMQIMSGEATDAQIGSFLTAMRMKGETVDEITGCAAVMREKSAKVIGEGDLLDIVGTGGDCANTFNVSTLSSIVAAAAGVKVAKHGNRSVSSKCGSADVLEALGVKIDLPPQKNNHILAKLGICFMFAPVYHSSMHFVAAPRRELGIRSIFNILGPLSSPACANLQVLGVYDENLVVPIASVLKNLGVKRAMVVHGQDGLDEVSLSAPTTVCEVKNDMLHHCVIKPEDFGFKRCSLGALKGGDAKENAKIALEILEGRKGPKRDMVVLNSAVALKTAFEDKSLEECIALAKEMLDSQKAMKKLKEFITQSQSV